MWLEIRKGRTGFPLRPISGDRFLIGAGSHCHLQLGGDTMPMLHSLLVIDGKRAYLEAVVPMPALQVNGQARRAVELVDEDHVTIGEFEFVFHRLVSSEPAAGVAEALPSAEQTTYDNLMQMSVPQLVARIEDEIHEIHAFEAGREAGASALLEAARHAAAAAPLALPMADFRKEPTAEKSLIEQLREQTTQLLEAHRAMAARLQEMTDQLTQLERQPLRVSA
jgi:hypothetical protein